MIPDRLMMELPGLKEQDYRLLSSEALTYAVHDAPKLTGNLGRALESIYGDDFFGIRWDQDYVWYQEAGINPFTMKNLAGKTIPMWLDDPDGQVKADNPKAEQRTIEGRVQTLIFRRAAQFGERKTVERDGQMVSVPRSYPGAPGRIAPSPRSGLNRGRLGGGRDEAGRIQAGNVGVRWRHPGLSKRGFIRGALEQACRTHGLPVGRVRDQFGSWR